MSKSTMATHKLLKGNNCHKQGEYSGAADLYKEAIKFYEEAIDAGDNGTATWENLGKAYLNLIAALINDQKFTEAIKFSKESEELVYEVDKKLVSASYYNLSLEQIKNQEFKQALPNLEKALENRPLDKDIQQAMLHTYCKLAEHSAANREDSTVLLDSAIKKFNEFNSLRAEGEDVAHKDY